MPDEMPASRPNVIWVFGDQHRAQAPGSMGDPNLHTPSLDRLAAKRRRLQSRLADWLADTGDEFPLPEIQGAARESPTAGVAALSSRKGSAPEWGRRSRSPGRKPWDRVPPQP